MIPPIRAKLTEKEISWPEKKCIKLFTNVITGEKKTKSKVILIWIIMIIIVNMMIMIKMKK